MSESLRKQIKEEATTMSEICEQADKICASCKMKDDVGCEKADCIVNERKFISETKVLGKLDEVAQQIREIFKERDLDSYLHDVLTVLVGEQQERETPILKDIADMPDFDSKVKDGLHSVSEGNVFWTDNNKVTCRKHGACLAVNKDCTIWRCAECHEGAYVIWKGEPEK